MSLPNPTSSNLLTPAQLAERLNINERTFSEWRIRGYGPAYFRLGKSIRYRTESVENWLLTQERQSATGEVL